MKHLHPSTARLIELSDQERINAVRATKWIPYTRAQEILRQMEDLFTYPPTDRPQNLLLVGDTNNGKSAILRQFVARHRPYEMEQDGSMRWPVLDFQCPNDCDEKRFYNAILDRLFVPYRNSDRADKKQRQVIAILKQVGVKVLVIDEIQHILVAGNQRRHTQLLNMIKFLSNELLIPMVCAGIRTALNAIQHDEQLKNRFDSETLHRWVIGDEYFRLLASFEQLLPLKKPSQLTDPSLAHRILSLSEGHIGEIAKVLRTASVLAITSKNEQITLPLLDKIKYVSPSDHLKFEKLASA